MSRPAASLAVVPDDARRRWDEPGVYTVAAGVHRIPLPLPQDGLHAVNVYAVEGDDGLVLVDGGWALAESRQRLADGLAALGAGLGDVRRILVTHVHRDHYTLAVTLRSEYGMRVALGAGEEVSLRTANDPSHPLLADQVAVLHTAGASVVAERILPGLRRAETPLEQWAPPDEWLDDGAVVPVAGRALHVVHTPGHTRGHVVFRDADAGLLFAGDHVLPHITPSIGFEQSPPPLPLRDFLGALQRVRDLPDATLLPAHGPSGGRVHARVDALLAHHAERLAHCRDLVGAGPATAYAVARALPWTRRRRSFDDLDPFNQLLAVLETVAHLDLLVHRGELARADPPAVGPAVVEYAPTTP